MLDARAARAQPDAVAERRVVLIDPGPELEQAVRAALEPWGVAIVVVTGPSPGATAPDANDAARALAEAQQAGAVVWISEHAGGHAMWVYDRQTHHVFERALVTGPPFAEPAAAAVALSIKTLLRHSATAPPEQRYGRPEAADAAAAEREQGAPLPAPREQPPAPIERSAGTAVPAASAETPFAEAAPETRRSAALAPRSRIDLALLGGARFAFSRPGAVEPRVVLAARWWPDGGPLGAGLAVGAGPGVAIDHARLRGRVIDAAARLSLELRTDLGSSLRAGAAAGVAGHLLALDGTVRDDGQDASALRASPALELQLRIDWALTSRVHVGLFADLAYLLRAERYLVGEDEVLELTHLGASAGLAVTLALLD